MRRHEAWLGRVKLREYESGLDILTVELHDKNPRVEPAAQVTAKIDMSKSDARALYSLLKSYLYAKPENKR